MQVSICRPSPARPSRRTNYIALTIRTIGRHEQVTNVSCVRMMTSEAENKHVVKKSMVVDHIRGSKEGDLRPRPLTSASDFVSLFGLPTCVRQVRRAIRGLASPQAVLCRYAMSCYVQARHRHQDVDIEGTNWVLRSARRTRRRHRFSACALCNRQRNISLRPHKCSEPSVKFRGRPRRVFASRSLSSAIRHF
ncbi:hypothetical protein L226DRAFT_153832 [Lentinus tigrinus ALCF2SS1-7]|uniref:uncharacterized protein n=1 Tax=Lentinus tigrinus ALCF2SS1-7 TaxID=1328758 RepID=UPI001165CBE3|nr:hypothetical protein L226DRAFT_153832 [Lentinus tigrinus ALCF2SS1-7]